MDYESLSQRIAREGALADIYGTLLREGHERAGKAMEGVLNPMIGSKVMVIDNAQNGFLFVAWEDLIIDDFQRMEITVYVRSWLGSSIPPFKIKVEVDLKIMSPENLMAMEVMLS